MRGLCPKYIVIALSHHAVLFCYLSANYLLVGLQGFIFMPRICRLRPLKTQSSSWWLSIGNTSKAPKLFSSNRPGTLTVREQATISLKGIIAKRFRASIIILTFRFVVGVSGSNLGKGWGTKLKSYCLLQHVVINTHG